jgi:hypothetical protein
MIARATLSAACVAASLSAGLGGPLAARALVQAGATHEAGLVVLLGAIALALLAMCGAAAFLDSKPRASRREYRHTNRKRRGY